MMISTRGRYALRVMIDLAEHRSSDFTALKGIAERQGISRKYLEGIMSVLSKGGLVEAIHGKGGGYRLAKAPEEYRVGDILRLTEGTLSPVACLEEGAEPCAKAAECRTLPLWTGLFERIGEYLDSVMLSDLMKKE